MTEEHTKAVPQVNENEATGWQAIDKALHQFYGEQEPVHYGTKHPFRLGGPDPLDGISAYRSDVDIAHWHFIKESENLNVSGFGIEFTFRLVRTHGEQQPPLWVFSFLQNLARYVFQTGKVFDIGHRMNGNGPIALEHQTDIHAVAFIQDPQLGEIETPHGRLKFLQVVGITGDELQAMQQWTTSDFLAVLAEGNPLLITDLNRKSLLSNADKAAIIHQKIKSETKNKNGFLGRFFS